MYIVQCTMYTVSTIESLLYFINKLTQVVAQASLLMYCAGANITYMVTVGDQLTDVCFYITNTTREY